MDETSDPTAARDKELEQILNEDRIRSVFQPIVSLSEGNVFGYEALSRGPIGTRLETANALFEAAQAIGATQRLEHVCRLCSIAAAAEMPSGCYLFLNVNPREIEEQNTALSREIIEQSPPAQGASSASSVQAAQRHGAAYVTYPRTRPVVFEISEKQPITDFDVFKLRLLSYYRQGFAVAIDNVGAGHNSLRTVTEIHPHFIKLDMALVRDIDRDRAKGALVSAMMIFAKRIDAKMVAQGIETVDELATLIEIGVDLGQGFLLGRPSTGFIEPRPEIAAFIRERAAASS